MAEEPGGHPHFWDGFPLLEACSARCDGARKIRVIAVTSTRSSCSIQMSMPPHRFDVRPDQLRHGGQPRGTLGS